MRLVLVTQTSPVSVPWELLDAELNRRRKQSWNAAFVSLHPSLKPFSPKGGGTSLGNQSEFHSCDATLVKVNPGSFHSTAGHRWSNWRWPLTFVMRSNLMAIWWRVKQVKPASTLWVNASAGIRFLFHVVLIASAGICRGLASVCNVETRLQTSAFSRQRGFPPR